MDNNNYDPIPGAPIPIELPGRNSSTYGDGDIPEIDLPREDDASHHIPPEFPGRTNGTY